MWEIFSKGQNPYQDISFENRDDFLEIVIKQGIVKNCRTREAFFCFSFLPEKKQNCKKLRSILCQHICFSMTLAWFLADRSLNVLF